MAVAVDFVPFVEGYPSACLFDTPFEQNGQAIQFFTSHCEGLVDYHFSLMEKHGIDGAFMQRFYRSISEPQGGWVEVSYTPRSRDVIHRVYVKFVETNSSADPPICKNRFAEIRPGVRSRIRSVRRRQFDLRRCGHDLERCRQAEASRTIRSLCILLPQQRASDRGLGNRHTQHRISSRHSTHRHRPQAGRLPRDHRSRNRLAEVDQRHI
jgi:hypothetical protein